MAFYACAIEIITLSSFDFVFFFLKTSTNKRHECVAIPCSRAAVVRASAAALSYQRASMYDDVRLRADAPTSQVTSPGRSESIARDQWETGHIPLSDIRAWAAHPLQSINRTLHRWKAQLATPRKCPAKEVRSAAVRRRKKKKKLLIFFFFT